MAREDFEERLGRIGAKPAQAAGAKPAGRRRSLAGFLFGAICSGVVLALFTNIQAISDMAPDSVKAGGTPGLFGAPVAILTVLWFAAIPLWFVGSILRDAIRMKGFVLPRPFVTGAFAGLAVWAGIVGLQTPTAS